MGRTLRNRQIIEPDYTTLGWADIYDVRVRGISQRGIPVVDQSCPRFAIDDRIFRGIAIEFKNVRLQLDQFLFGFLELASFG